MIGLAEKGFANIEVTVTGHAGTQLDARAWDRGRGVVGRDGGHRKEPFPFPAHSRGCPILRLGRAACARTHRHRPAAPEAAVAPLARGADRDESVDALLRTTQAVTIIRSGGLPP